MISLSYFSYVNSYLRIQTSFQEVLQSTEFKDEYLSIYYKEFIYDLITMNSRAHKTDDKSTCFAAAVRPSGAVAKKCVLLSTLEPQT